MIFSNLWTRKKEIDSGAIDSYALALKAFSDEMIANAAEKCLRECTKFPSPIDIIARMDAKTHMIGSGEDFLIYDHQSCEECGNRDVMCIKEPIDGGVWICRRCYTGLTPRELGAKFKELGEMMKTMSLNGEINYRTEAQQKSVLDEQKKAIQDEDIPF